MAARAANVGISAEAILNELAIIANARVEHYEVDDYGNLRPSALAPEGAMAAIKSIRKSVHYGKDGQVTYNVSFELWDKPGQLKLLGKHVGVKACFDKLEVTGPDGGPLQVEEVRSVVVDPKEGA